MNLMNNNYFFSEIALNKYIYFLKYTYYRDELSYLYLNYYLMHIKFIFVVPILSNIIYTFFLNFCFRKALWCMP